MSKMSFLSQVYNNRRLRLAHHMRKGVAIIPASKEQVRNRDNHFPYRPDSYFYYLTGFEEPEALLVLVAGKQPRNTLFCREKDPEKEVWTGRRFGPEGAKEVFGFDETYPITAVEQKMPELLNQQVVYVHLGEDNSWNTRVIDWINKTKDSHVAIKDVRTILDEMRLIKQTEEVSIMREAAMISARAHREAMRKCRPGMMEYELETVLTREFRIHGGDQLHAYPPIIAGGENACTLHYGKNNCVLRNGELILIDAGCELGYYASDITRTFPINGRFSPEQKAIYEIVLRAQLAGIEQTVPGKHFREAHKVATGIIAEGLYELGLIQGNPKKLQRDAEQFAELPRGKRDNYFAMLEKKDGEQPPPWFMNGKLHFDFFMHNAGHFLGMDVHDVGKQSIGKKWRLLRPGMVMTVEPGIYIAPGNEKIDKKWWGIGVRIEDDVLVTESGYEVLSSYAPKTIEEIESVMQKADKNELSI